MSWILKVFSLLDNLARQFLLYSAFGSKMLIYVEIEKSNDSHINN